MNTFTQLYSDKWLKEIKLAIKSPTFKTKPPINPIEHRDLLGVFTPSGKYRTATEKEFTNYLLALTLLETTIG